MDGATGAELLSPGEAEWPPELRLPPPPPMPEPPPPPAPAPAPASSLRGWSSPSPAPHLHLHHPPAAAAALPPKKKDPSPPRAHSSEGFDDQQFLGSIMGPPAAPPQQQQQQPQPVAPPAPVKRKRGRPPKNRDGAAAAPAPARPAARKEEEVVCFICFDGGNLVVCDRRGCPKVYHPACIKRDESFFRCRGKWDCGWHICSGCEKAVQYMCYTCTYSVCKGCIKPGKFFGVRGNKGFCDTCFGTILLIESKDDGAKVNVDFDDKNSWEYLFKLYWLDLKGKHLLTLEELKNAKSHWAVPTPAGRREKEESSDELYDANKDEDASFDISSRKRRRNNSTGKRGQKRKKDSGITASKCGISIESAGSLPNRSNEGAALPGDAKWASSELLEFIEHMRNGDCSYISQFDVQVLLLEYINQNNLRDPRKKSQIICDARLTNLFRKPRVAHFEMLKLLEMHYVAKQPPTANADSQRAIHPDSAQVDDGGYDELTAKVSDKRRKAQKKIERDPTTNPEEYAAIDMHNINLIYLRRSLMEDLIDDDAALSDKIAGAFVRIRISGLGQKQDMYRLVKVLGTHKVAERYNVGQKTTDCALEISNLGKKEVITMDTISNQDFTEEECKRLRQSMKFGLTTPLKVGDIYEKAKVFQSLRVKDWLENEKQRLSHLRDRASETGRRKQLRECVEKLQILNTPEERARMISDVPEVHVDPHMAPDYESAEEQDYKKDVDWSTNRNGQHQDHRQKCLDAPVHTGGLPTEGVTHRSGAGNNINLNNTVFETASLPPSGAVTTDTEPEKVWHYKDPDGKVHGPFTLSQLSKWTSFFPRDLRIWLTFESEENSLLLTEVLTKQQKDFLPPTSLTTSEKIILSSSGQDRVNSNLVANNASPPIGYNVVCSSALPSQSTECCEPTKMDPKVLGGTSPSRSLKDGHTMQGQEQHQINYPCTISGSADSPQPSISYDVWVPREMVGKQNNCQDKGGIWSPTIAPMNHSSKSNVEQHSDQKSVGHLNSQMDSGAHKISVLTPQQYERHPATSLSPTSPSELKTIGQQKLSCWSSATNDGNHDLRLSISLAKPESCLPTHPVEVKSLSSASAMLTQSGVPARVSHPVPSMSTLNSIKTEEPMNQHKSCHADASNEPFDQHRKPTSGPVLSSKTQDHECEYPSPTPKLERKDSSMNHSGSTSLAPEALLKKTCVNSSISSVSQTSCAPPCKIESVQSPKETSCLEERHLRDSDSINQTKHLNEGSIVVKKDKVVSAVSDAEGIAVSDVLESLTGRDCEKYSISGAAPSENFLPAPADEEQPQCSSPIALSPWGDPSYYQGEAVDSALWGVQDDPSNVMWSMPSPTPALHTSGLGADGKHSSCIIEEAIAAQGNTAFGETLPAQGEKKMEQGKSSASTDSAVLEQVEPKPGAASGIQDGRTKASDWRPPALSLEGIVNANASCWQSSGSSTQGSAKASGWQRSSSPSDWSRKASGWQPSGASTEGSAKASGWQRSSTSPDGGRKASGWQRSRSPPDGSKKAPGRQPSGSSADGSAKASGSQRPSASPEGTRKASGRLRPGSKTQGSAKVDGWQRTSASPEGNRKATGWHASGRESSKVNSTSGGNDNRRSSSGHLATTPTGKHSSEVPKRQGNGDKNTSGWEEAIANSSEVSKRHGSRDKNDGWGEASNKSWHTSSGNASRGSQGSHHHHDRHSYGSDSRRGSSHHSRRPDHHRHDHGNGPTPRSSSRTCKYFDNGHCWRGSNCQFIHRGSSR